MRLVELNDEAPSEAGSNELSFEEPENKLAADLGEARRYTELDRLLYRVLQLHAIHERRTSTESEDEGSALQRQLYEAQQRLDQLFDEIR